MLRLRKKRWFLFLVLAVLWALGGLAFFFPLSPFFVRQGDPNLVLGPWLEPFSEGKLLLRVEGPERPLEAIGTPGGAWTLGQGRKTALGTEYEAVLTGGFCEAFSFRLGQTPLTVPAEGACGVPQRLAFVADYQNGPRFKPEKISSLLGFQPQLLLFGGDGPQFPADRRRWQDLSLAWGRLLAQTPLLAAAGNHDFMRFQPSSLRFCDWYLNGACQGPRRFQRGPLDLLLLPFGWPEERILEELSGLVGPLKVVVLHHPPLSEGFHGSAYEGRLAAALAGRVQLVLSGHNHNYERFLRQDTHFVTVSSLGARRYKQGAGLTEGLQKAQCCADGLLLDLAPGALTVRAVDLSTGQEQDRFSINW